MRKFEKSAGAIIFRIEGNNIFYLLLKYPTYWGFAKGNIEEKENEEQTALREIKEETGLNDIVLLKGFKENIAWFYRMNNELRRKEAIFFLAETKTKEIKISKEHNDFKWLSYEEALKLIKIKSNKQLMEKADKFIHEYLKQKTLL